MKPLFETIQLEANSSIRALHYKCAAFQDDHGWHYHREYELSYIVNGEGTRFVGDSIEHYKKGDLVFLGPNVPHCWTSHDNHALDKQQCEMIVVQFPEFEEIMTNIPEAAQLKKLFEHSKRGLFFSGSTVNAAQQLMKEINSEAGLLRLSLLFKLLHLLCNDKNYKKLSSENQIIDNNQFQDSRMENILAYIHENLSSELKQTDAAALVSMTPQSFSRFFKVTTGRTFVSFVNEMRIAQACQALVNSEQSILDISLECGYPNLSNFNRRFSELKGTTPSAYRNKHQQLLNPEN